MPSAPSSSATTQPLILIVDDEQVLLDCLELVLQLAGYRVLTAQNGVAALRLLARDCPDAIVLDLQMPLMDGLTFADEYASLPGPHAPIILLTASDRGNSAAAQIGAACVIAKPFDVDALLKSIEALVAGPAQSSGDAAPAAAPLAEASG